MVVLQDDLALRAFRNEHLNKLDRVEDRNEVGLFICREHFLGWLGKIPSAVDVCYAIGL